MKINISLICALILSLVIFNSCEKLSLQRDADYNAQTLDPQQGITAWEYLNKPRADTLFNEMIRAIKYASMEEEYKKSDRTYIFLINSALSSRNATTGVESTTSYFGINKVNGVAATKWSDYPVEQIKDLLQYHIIQGRYTYDNLTPDLKETTTLRANASKNKVYINIGNTNSFKIEFNNFPKSIKTQQARTANLQMTQNCVVHVLPTFMEYGFLP